MKDANSDACRVSVRILESKTATLKELADRDLGLYIPLNQLTEAELVKLKAFLETVDVEPIALAHSAATDD